MNGQYLLGVWSNRRPIGVGRLCEGHEIRGHEDAGDAVDREKSGKGVIVGGRRQRRRASNIATD